MLYNESGLNTYYCGTEVESAVSAVKSICCIKLNLASVIPFAGFNTEGFCKDDVTLVLVDDP